MDPERARAELRRLLEELPEDRRPTWRPTCDLIADEFAACRATVQDLSAAADLAGVLREANSTIGECTAVLRDTRAELARRVVLPDAAQVARIAAVIGPILAAAGGSAAYALSGGAVGSVEVLP